MNKANALIYCKDEYSVQKNERLLSLYEHIYLVSSDMNVKKCIYERPTVEFIPFDSNREGFFRETWNIIDKLNEEIEKQKLRESAYLYKGCYLIEGGFAQEIADVLYAINIFQTIIVDKEIDIIYGDRKSDIAELWALQAIAKSMNIKMCYLSGGMNSISEYRQWISRAYYPGSRGIISFKGKLDSLGDIIKNAKQSKKSRTRATKQYDVGFMLVFDTNKHMHWLLNSLKSFDERLNYCVFCMGADGAREKLQKMGQNAESVEKYYLARYIFTSIPNYVWDTHLIARAVKKNVKCSFENVDITNIVVNLYLRNLREEKLSNLIYERIITAFLQENKAFLLTGNGETNYISYQLFYHVAQKLGMKTMFYKDNTNVEILNVERMVYEPYADIMNFRFFSKGSGYLKALRASGWNGKVFYFRDLLYYDSYKRYSSITTKVNKKVQILWAPSYPSKGIYSVKSFLSSNEFIIEQCRNKNLDLRIKYHPSQSEALVHDIVMKGRQYNNITFVDKAESIEEYIEQADIVITSPSTVILDAALKKKVVICLVDSQGYQLVKHLEEGFIIKKQDELNIDEYVNAASKKLGPQSNYENYLKRQWDFIKRFYEGESNVSDILISMIDGIKKEKSEIFDGQTI